MCFLDLRYSGDEAQRAAFKASRVSITVVQLSDWHAGERAKLGSKPVATWIAETNQGRTRYGPSKIISDIPKSSPRDQQLTLLEPSEPF